MYRRFGFELLVAALALGGSAFAADQRTPSQNWAAHAVTQYFPQTDITYLKTDKFEVKLDVFRRRGGTTPLPTVVYIHGGGWIGGQKGGTLNLLMPWFEMGFNIVNVEYRLARVAPAPAAVEDCLCALRFVASKAQTYGIDVNKIVLSGESAGGHLALTTGMIPESAGLDKECPGPALPKVAAIVNFYGITDVADLLGGPNEKSYAVSWLTNVENKAEVAKQVSPLTYVRPGLPPIISIQGDQDPTVPYTHSLRLQEALEKAGIPHQLVTIPGGKHGNFTGDEYAHIYDEVRAFLGKYDLLPKQ